MTGTVTELAVCLLDILDGGILFSTSAVGASTLAGEADARWAVPGPHSSFV